jgi:hypothetical protein
MILNSKSQNPNKFQAQNSCLLAGRQNSLKFRILNLFGVWDLVFGNL